MPKMLLLVTLLAAALVAPAALAQECVDYAASPKSLVDLESGASKGALTQAEKDCLEKAYGAAKEQTTKDKISRVLLVNAYAYNTKYWAKLVQRHLDEVDRSDPDIAYLYAFYLYNTENGDEEVVIRWTEIALERRDTWTGNVYVSRVFGLMRLRTMAANALWQAAEDANVKAGGTSSNLAVIDEARNRTKTFAREWVDFAKVAGRNPSDALQLCISAASERACGVEEESGTSAP